MSRIAITWSAAGMIVTAALALALIPRHHADPAPSPAPVPESVFTSPPAASPALPIGRVSTELDVPAPDLDGDGVPEELLPRPDSCGTGGCVYDVFMSSPPRKKLGTIAGKWGYWSTRPRRGTFADIETAWFLGCCDVALTTYRFKRGAYREIKSRRCDPREGHKPACD